MEIKFSSAALGSETPEIVMSKFIGYVMDVHFHDHQDCEYGLELDEVNVQSGTLKFHKHGNPRVTTVLDRASIKEVFIV